MSLQPHWRGWGSTVIAWSLTISITSTPDPATAADARRAQQLGARLHDGVAADAHVDVDPRARGVDDRYARPLVGRDDAPVQFGGEVRQLDPVVDTRHQGGVVDVHGAHDLAVLPDDREDVGDVELLLGVVGPQSVQFTRVSWWEPM